MADHHHGDIIIVKKKGGGGHGHHGGAWKIAFADFMTAMMAFFLVLWIINATDKDTKTVIARYFNPVKLENPSKAKKGVHGETSAQTESKEEKSENAAAAPTKDKEPQGSPPSDKSDKAGKRETPASPAAPAAEAKAPAAQTQAAQTQAAQTQAAEAKLFSAPYEALDRIVAGETAPGAPPDKGDADPQRLNGALSVDSFRDPFKPIGPGSPDDPAAFDAEARNQAPPDLEPGKTGAEDKPRAKPIMATRIVGDKPATGEAAKAAPAGGLAETGKANDGAKASGEAGQFDKEWQQKVEAAVGGGPGPAIEAKQTKDGLLISLTDKFDFSMFGVGSAEPKPELIRAMDAVAELLKTTPGHIVLRGYTDARPYRNGAYDNWRLSADRAQMAYYMLTRGGAPAARFTRVEGYADRALKDPGHPLAAVNRRLEILVEGAKP